MARRARVSWRLLGVQIGFGLTFVLLAASSAAQEDEAEAELKLVIAKAGNDADKLSVDLRTFARRYPGTVQAVKAMAALRDLPSPMDQLDPKGIPALEKFAWQPKELVAVFGEHKGRQAGPVTAVAYSRNGKDLVSGSSDGSIRFWDPATMRLVYHLGQSYGSLALAFNKESTMLASGGGDGHLRLWDLLDGKPPKDKQTIKVSSTPLYAVAVSPGGKLLAVGGGDNRLYLWDITDKMPRETAAADAHTGAVMAVTYSPDGRTIATASQDKTIRLWSVTKELKAKEKSVVEAHAAGVLALAYHPNDDKVLISGAADGTICVWNVGGAQPVRRQLIKTSAGAIHALAFSMSGKTLASAHADGTARTWTVGAVVQEKALLEGHIGSASSVAFAPDAQSLATGSQDWTVRLWPTISGPKPKDRTIKEGHLSHVYTLGASPDGKSLASGSYDRTLRVWDVVKGDGVERLPSIKFDAAVYSVAFSPDGKSVAGGGANAFFRAYNVASRSLPTTFQGHKGQISRLTYSPDGSLLASCSNDMTARLWDAKSGKELHIFDSYEAPVHSIAFTPDGKGVVTASGQYLRDKKGFIVYKDGMPLFLDSTVRLYEVEGKKETERWKDEKVLMSSLAFAPDGRRLFAGGSDAILRTWTFPNRKFEPAVFIKGTYAGIGSLAVTPDGRWLASHGPDYQVRLWDLAAGQEVRSWSLQERFAALAFTADSRHLAIGLATGVIYVLRLEGPGMNR